ncbi:MAG: response regulator transcription factor [Sulfurimonas sp.]|nr:response regulator transcription factor [Sulfurimonas sp.]
MDNKQKPYSILFVEDEKEIRDNYTKYLKRHFLNVYEAVDGEEGYSIYKNKKPNIMIVDINLPKLNGLDLVKRIRENDQNTKVIMLTAYSNTNYLLEAVELKLVKYLIKPISRDELKKALDLAVLEFSKFDVKSKKVINLEDEFVWSYTNEEMLHNGVEVLFTNKEKQIIKLLLLNPNIVFTYEEIIDDVWENSEDNKLNPLKTIIKNIRKKLPKDTIKNIFGVGYKF